MMRINLLPPDLRRGKRKGVNLLMVVLVLGLCLATYLGYLASGIYWEYPKAVAKVEAQRKTIEVLQQSKIKAQSLQVDLAKIETNLEFLLRLPKENIPTIGTSALLEHIARSSAQSGEVWLNEVFLSKTGDVTLRGLGKEPQGMTNLVHRLSRWPSFYGIDIQSLRRVEQDSRVLIEFGAQVSKPEEGGTDDESQR